jgi:endonuclease III
VSAADPTKKLQALLKRLRAKHPAPTPAAAPEWEGVEPTIRELLFSMLLADAPSTDALEAFARIRSQFVDLNDLRIALSDEVTELLGEEYPLRQERATRIKACLTEVYQRESSMSLAALAEAGRRECRQYLESLNGMTPFTVSRLKLICFGGSTIPVDDTLLSKLHKEHALEVGATCDSASHWLAKHVEPHQSLSLHALFQAWLDSGTEPAMAPRPSRSKPKDAPKSTPKPKGTKKAKAT